MNERYREAAEQLRYMSVPYRDREEEWAKLCKRSLELGSDILSKLASGEWVLCDGKDVMQIVSTTDFRLRHGAVLAVPMKLYAPVELP